jgi:hypothetical protein
LGVPNLGLEVEQVSELVRFNLANINDLLRHRDPFTPSKNARPTTPLAPLSEVLGCKFAAGLLSP